MSEETVTLTARCLCRAHSFTAAVPASALPLAATLCHCDSCRHLTGALFFVDVDWPGRDDDVSGLRRYAFSDRIDIFFCGTCSSPLFCRGVDHGDPLCVNTGALDNGPGLVRYAKHIFVGDTLDGGASMWLRTRRDGSAVPRLATRTDSLAHEWPGPEPSPDPDAVAGPERTPVRCRCGGVDLSLRSAADLASRAPSELPWFVDPKTYKYLANTDGCDSCRTTFGADLVNWTFALLTHVDYAPAADQDPAAEFPRAVEALHAAVSASDRDPRLGTLAVYESSPGVQRYFCSRCSASVFYAVNDRPEMIDVAVGLLHHPSGARAEGLLKWNLGGNRGIGSLDDTKGGWREDLAEGARQEAEKWRVDRGYPMSWHRERMEAAQKPA